uniref:Uncharacterized protein n=1 Tax=Meloidogyne enterolobii TaxID=390850 RepID=A0A6V7XZW8_MELEN|nr:unnamed protein product [Meloidogyne enterolobii]
MSFKSNLILFLIFNSILIEICDSMFTAKFKNMNEDGCKEYGFQCDGESVKFKNEKIEHLKKTPILLRSPNNLREEYSVNGIKTAFPNKEHQNDFEQASSSIFNHASQHKEMFAPGDQTSFYRVNSSYTTLKLAKEGISPFELDKSKFGGTIRLPKNKKNKGTLSYF